MVFIPADPASFRFRRSALFMPATNIRALQKAPSLDCDCLIFDLEDAIAGEDRAAAHSNLLTHVKGRDFGRRERIIRIGNIDDLEIALQLRPDAVLVPKISFPNDLTGIAQILDQAGSAIPLWAMIETPAALMNLREIAGASRRLATLVVGPNDLAKDTGIKPEKGRPNLHPFLMMIIAAARANGLAVLDGVYNNFRDSEGFAEECRDAAAMGFDGKTLIHPSQIDPANSAFGASEAELDTARAIINAFALPQNALKGVIQLDGEMVERLHLQQAEALIALSEKLQEK